MTNEAVDYYFPLIFHRSTVLDYQFR